MHITNSKKKEAEMVDKFIEDAAESLEEKGKVRIKKNGVNTVISKIEGVFSLFRC